jgi:hypothetical protein
MKIVTIVPLTEFKLINQLVHVQLVPMKLMLLLVQNVLINVVLVLITLLVLLVVKKELTLQPVTVKMDIMKMPKFVENVHTNV